MNYLSVLLLFYFSPSALPCAATVPSPGVTTTTRSPIITTTTTTTPRITTRTTTRTTTTRSPVTTTTTSRTTTTTTTTTTATTTTTTVPLACASCMASQVTFTPSNGMPGSIDAMFRLEPVDANGCAVLTAVCLAQNGFYSFMQFNVNQGGPRENQLMGQETDARLTCMNGMWYYDNVREVTEVNCIEAMLP